MLAEIAAANAAFAVIKGAIQNGRQIADVASQVGKYVNATEDLRRKGEKKKRAGGADLEEFMHLEKLRQQEEELKQLMIYTGRPGLWHDWIKFQAQARKDRLAAAEARKRKIEQWIEIAIIVLVCVVGTVGLAALVAWAFYLKGI
tara:strand:+ start:914 stop:1348 length:435 start_codon:yes stop_codon:yes gene_type:complete